MQDGQWGVVDANGTVIVQLEYQDIGIWSDGLILARKDDRAALFAPDGTVLVPLRYQYLYGNDASAGGSDDNSWFWAQDQWGRERWIVGVGGEPLLGPGLNPLMPFDGKDRFVVTEDDGRSGILSFDCEWVLLPSLRRIGTLADNGLAWAQSSEGQEGFIDAEGQWVIEPGRFDRLGSFAADGLAPAQTAGKWGFIDAHGDWVIPPTAAFAYSWPQAFNSAGLTVFEKDGKSGLLNRQGEWVVEPLFDGITEYIDSSFIATRAGERRRFSGAGEDLGLAPFDADNFVRYDESRTGRTVRGGRPMLVDWSGREVLGKGFDDVMPFGDRDWAPARKGGKWGAVNAQGDWVLRPDYECVGQCPLLPGGMPPMPIIATAQTSRPIVTYPPSHPRYTDPRSQDWCHAGG